MTEKCPACGGISDPEIEDIFQRAITHVLDFAEAAIREKWPVDGETADIHADWYDAMVEGLVAATTEIAFRAAEGKADRADIAEDLLDMLAAHVDTALDDPEEGSMVQ